MTWPPRLERVAHRGRVEIAPPPEPDVLKLVPATEDIKHLDAVWRLDAESSPIEALMLWQPEDAADVDVRSFLLDFAYRVLRAAGAVRR